MKKHAMALTVLVLAGVLPAGNALAAGSTDLNVSATVVGTCSFSAASYSMEFGSISVTDTGPKTAEATLQFTCTNNTSYTITNIAGARELTGPVGPLAYTIAPYVNQAVANGAQQSVTLTGTIAQVAYQGAAAGTYSETVTLEINP